MKPAKLLHGVAILLYGERWLFPLARQLGVKPRTITRWTAGTMPIPPAVWRVLLKADYEDRLDPVRWRVERLAADQSGSGQRPDPAPAVPIR